MGYIRCRVGSWPGRQYRDNLFIRTICEAVASFGVTIVDVPDPKQVSGSDIDILWIHWPEEIFWRNAGGYSAIIEIARTVLKVRTLKRDGVRIAWLVHNLTPHDASRAKLVIWKFYIRILSSFVDDVITLSPATLPIVLGALPFRKTVRRLSIRHPVYGRVQPSNGLEGTRNASSQKLHLAFVGAIKGYKGVPDLVNAVLGDDEGEFALFVGGDVGNLSLRKRLNQLCVNDERVQFLPRRLSEIEYENAVVNADYVILPFQKMLHSGSIIHALSLGTPVLTPHTPYAAELASIVGKSWVQTYRGRINLTKLRALPPPPCGQPDLSLFRPEVIGRELATFFKGN